MAIPKESIEKMKELTRIGKKKGKRLTLEQLFAKHPGEWCLIDGKPVHVDDLPN